MPKMKTHSGSKKRFRITGSGKLMRGKAFKSHIKTKKSPKRIRGFRKDVEISAADNKTVATRLGLR
ncbi:MAG: 50S ribosomal protein L35 [Eggerthellaceae bacterium]|nr:50S ribosomal protein L35 [Eggerthellaceae bacterium]